MKDPAISEKEKLDAGADSPESLEVHPPGEALGQDFAPDCWNISGSFGDSSCPKLSGAILCRNCSVYSNAGRDLLERKPPEGYIAEWTELLLEQKDKRAATKAAVIIFRLGSEWLALPAQVFRELAPMRPVHFIPHRSGPILKGLANVLGTLRLCVSLHDLLGIEKIERPAGRRSGGPRTYERLAVVEKAGECWVFPVDEVYGMYRFDSDELQSVPVTVSRSAVSYTKGLFSCEERSVGLLDEELLFYSLKRSIS